MYKLGYICCVNYIAYMAGLNLKKFELDFTGMLDKTVIAILGDNGLGKSALGSMIHPSHLPISHNKKYVMRGKEGRLIRHYYGPDGKVIEVQTISMPKNSTDDEAWTHSNKSFFAIREGENVTELNPSGNIDTYYMLVHQYFGISMSTMNLMIYNKKMEGLVAMSSSERINRVSDLIPNTQELIDRYKIGSEGFKRVRNEMKNIDQKLGRLKDSSVLKAELSSLENAINHFVDKREKLIEDLAVCRADRNRLTSTEDDSISKTYKELLYKYEDLLAKLKRIESSLMKFDMSKSLIEVSMKKVELEGEYNLLSQKYTTISDKITEIEKEIEELSGDIISQETENIDDLKEELTILEEKRKKLQYSKYVGKFNNFNYQTAQMLHNALELINDQYSALIDHYGDIVSQYFGNKGIFAGDTDIKRIEKQIGLYDSEYMTYVSKYDQLEKQIRLLEAKSYMKDVLNKRPTNCTVNDCAFIVESLDWPRIENELDTLKDESVHIQKKITEAKDKLDDLKQVMTFLYNISTFESMLVTNKDIIKSYLKVDMVDIRKGFASGVPHSIFCLVEIRDIMSILSEKEYYEELTAGIISIETVIDKIQITSGSYTKIKDKIAKLEGKTNELYTSKIKIKDDRDHISDKIEVLSDIILDISERDELISQRDSHIIMIEEMKKELVSLKERLSIIEEIDSLISAKKDALTDIDNKVTPMVKQRDIIKYELNQRHTLELERDELTEMFLILELITEITKPGKGMWKALFNLYMEDVREVANMLLTQTFDGNLHLEKFDIKTDKFTIPYSFQGVLGEDAAEASGAQRAAISICMALGMVENIISKYGILVFDEADKDMSPKRKEEFVNILLNRLKYIGVSQTFTITHSPDNYMREEVGYVLFPGHALDLDMVKKREYLKVA